MTVLVLCSEITESAFEQFMFNGRKCIFMPGETKFLVQIGKGSKGSFKTKYSLWNPKDALFWYLGVNIGYGYKKRIFVPSFNKPTLIVERS